jgi:hypothetical protein
MTAKNMKLGVVMASLLVMGNAVAADVKAPETVKAPENVKAKAEPKVVSPSASEKRNDCRRCKIF